MKTKQHDRAMIINGLVLSVTAPTLERSMAARRLTERLINLAGLSEAAYQSCCREAEKILKSNGVEGVYAA